MNETTHSIPGYTYGTPAVTASSATLGDLQRLKISVGLHRSIRLGGSRCIFRWRCGGSLNCISSDLIWHVMPDSDPNYGSRV